MKKGEEGLQGREERELWTHAGISPFSFMRRFSEEMDRLFEDFGFGSSIFSPMTSTGGGRISRREFGRGIWTPPIEMFTRGDQLVVRAELPGLSKEDVKAEVTDHAIMLRGERRQEKEENREGANLLLPDPGGIGKNRAFGKDSTSKLSPSWLTTLGEEAARAHNEIR